MVDKEGDIERYLCNLRDEYITLGREISAIDEKIDAVNRAIDEAKEALDCLEVLQRRIKKAVPSDLWRGDRKKEHEKGRTETIPASMKRYSNDIERLIDGMRDERKKLKQQRFDSFASLFSVRDNIERIEKSLRE